MSLEYLNFDVLIHRTPDGLSARVIASPAGEAAVSFILPAELDTVATSAAQWSTEAVHAAGAALFQAVFSGEFLACYRSSHAEAGRRGRGLRLRFRLGNTLELAWVPWELLNDPQRGFLGQFADTTIVRYLELPGAARPPKLKLPLRILAVFSSPEDENYPPIDAEREWLALQQVLGPLQERGLLAIEPLHDARLEVLQERLQTGRFHVLHFVGHSGVDSTGEEGLVVLETGGGRGHRVSAAVFRTLLADRDLRLVVLNSCESARPGSRGLFSGVAQALVQAGIPAVVAMQFPIRDDAASTMAAPFYRELALSRPVDAALAEARKSVSSLGGAAWATPVVFLRAKEGRIFAPPPPPLGRRLVRAVPHTLLTLNWLLLLFAIKRVGFYLVPWMDFLSIAGAVLAGLALLAYFIPLNWSELVPGLLRRSNGSLRSLPVSASLLLSMALLGTALRSAPSVKLEHVAQGPIDSAEGPKLEMPQTPAGVSNKDLCDPSVAAVASVAGPSVPGPRCERPLPPQGYLKLQYRLGLNRVSSYGIRLSVEPAEWVGLATLRTDPALDLEAHPSSSADPHNAGGVRAWTVGNYDLYIVSRRDADRGDLTGTVEIRLLGRELYPQHAGTIPSLRATFATAVEMKETVDALTGCWSLLDGSRMDCSAFAAGGTR